MSLSSDRLNRTALRIPRSFRPTCPTVIVSLAHDRVFLGITYRDTHTHMYTQTYIYTPRCASSADISNRARVTFTTNGRTPSPIGRADAKNSPGFASWRRMKLRERKKKDKEDLSRISAVTCRGRVCARRQTRSERERSMFVEDYDHNRNFRLRSQKILHWIRTRAIR